MISRRVLIFGVVMLFNGIYTYFDFFPKSVSSKLNFGEDGNKYMGLIFITLGIFLIGYDINKKRKSNNKKKH